MFNNFCVLYQQDSLRQFIPQMINQVEGITKLKMGKDSVKPPWWPKHVPWCNIRNDTRSQSDIKKVNFSLKCTSFMQQK